MGALIIIVPIVIYYYLIKWLFNKYYKDTNKTKRKIYFILLITLPFWDHIAGYAYYKYLCFSKGGITIYKTVTDLQEQKDYWFYEGLNVFDNSYKDKEFKYLSNNNLVKRGICTNLLKDGNVGERICAKDGFKIVYLNYCNNKYNNLPTTHKNYKNSCTNANKLIKKYDLKNVIKVPRSPYIYSTQWNRILPLWLTFDIKQVKNYQTKEILGENIEITFWGGWFINIFNPFENRGERCNYTSSTNLQELIIRNPYKNKKITQGK